MFSDPIRTSILDFLRHPAVSKPLRWLQIGLAVFAVIFVILLVSTVSIGKNRFGIATLALIPLFSFATTAIHEAGHFVAARLGGMVIISARIGPLELLALLTGWKARLCRPRIRPDAGGYILAIPDFSRSLRRQEIPFVLGGPMANLVIAMLAGAAAWSSVDPYATLCWAFGVMNFTVGVANLLPIATNRSDGYLLLVWLIQDRKEDPSLAPVKLLWLSISGVTAENLPQQELEATEAQSTMGSLIRRWYAMKAAQNLGDWLRAAACGSEIATAAGSLKPNEFKQAQSFLNHVRMEVMFSTAIAARDSSSLKDYVWLRDSAWHSPYLLPRILALRAALSADEANCIRFLKASEREAEKSIDSALRTSERQLRAVVLRLLQNVDQNPLPS